MVFDQAMYGSIAVYHDLKIEECIAGIRAAGGVVVIANTIDEVADALAKLPTPAHKANLLKTITEYNAAIGTGKGAELQVARTGYSAKIEKPPFYAIPTSPRVYACFGGLAINQYAQVLDTQQAPVPNLYAIPPTAGGVMRNVYTGMIGCGGTFGWIAGNYIAAIFKKG